MRKDSAVILQIDARPRCCCHSQASEIPWNALLLVIHDFWIEEEILGHGLSADHSSRIRIVGLTASAFCAGSHAAARPSSTMVRTTPPKTSGSFGAAW